MSPANPTYALKPVNYGSMLPGERIAQARRAIGLTQTELAEAIGMGKTGKMLVSHWERGRRALTVDMLVRLALALETTPDAILGFGEQKQGRRRA